MSVNRYFPHIFVFPEDDANRQLATGFLLHPQVRQGRIHIVREAGGWPRVRDRFISDHVAGMQKYPERFAIFLVDFDQDEDRLQDVCTGIPDGLIDRVFVLGTWNEAEDLKRAGLGPYEDIGKAMAEECQTGTDAIWGHKLLLHNTSELSRVRQRLFPVLFAPI